MEQRRILAIGAHAGDMEIACGAVLIQEAHLGTEVHLLHLSRRDKRFRSSLYAREGLYSQHRYSAQALYGLTYEQAIDFSKTTALIWNIGWDRKIYDGDSTHVWSGYAGFRKNF